MFEEFTPTTIDPKTVSPRPTGIRYGVILGLISLVLTIIFILTDTMDFSGTKSNWIPNLLSTIATIAILYMMIKHHKENELGGNLNLGRCASLGLWNGLISGLMTAIGLYIYFAFIEPDYFAGVFDTIREKMLEEGKATAENIDQIMEMTQKFMGPGMIAIFAIVGSIVTCILFSVIIGLFLRKKAE